MIGRKAESALARQILPMLTLAELNQLGTSFGGAGNRVILIDGPEAGKAALPTRERVGCHACVTSCKEWNTSGAAGFMADDNPIR